MSNLSFTFPLKIMALPFRWPLQKQDLLLATEVASRQAIKQSEFEPIASVLSMEFGKLTPGKPVSLTARACGERMERLLEKYIFLTNKVLIFRGKVVRNTHNPLLLPLNQERLANINFRANRERRAPNRKPRFAVRGFL